MHCLEFRRRCAENPGDEDPRIAAHARDCESCAAYWHRLKRLDAQILRSLQVDVPATPPVVPPVGHARPLRQHRLVALLGAVVVASFLLVWWSTHRTSHDASLNSEIVAHVLNELETLDPTRPPISADAVQNLLANHGLRLYADIDSIVLARTCLFRDHLVAHLIVLTETGPVTLLLLPELTVPDAMAIDHGQMIGRILPIGRGSAAIVGHHIPAAVESALLEAVGSAV